VDPEPDPEIDVMDPDPAPYPKLDLILTKNHQKNQKFVNNDIKNTFI
jgi:hypothetical protein